ncbi:hypothetical protein [Neomegalonema sp.]|uniref:hypothetical protein n=1 Tax=Neomegalonema sp. TaxID=2039713 RepID=UPI002608E1D0|nr:hypothetical protein [Neomegalonema sp.]MDD2869134.1 hypothetical protein [Neomegalonema sp.]
MRRFFGFFFLILGIAAAFLDYAATEGPPTAVDLRPFGQYWERLHAASLQGFAGFAAEEFSQGFWNGAVRPLLEAPGALVSLGLGAFLLVWSRLSGRLRRRRRSG